METEKLNVVFPEGKDKVELVIREGAAVKELEPKPPVKTSINGTIGSLFEFLLKRLDQPEQVNQKRCHILVDRAKISMTLIINENDDYNKGTIVGKLEKNPKFVEFGINSNKVWTPTALGLFFKMNRSFFTSRDENMKLVSELMNFTAVVNNSIERGAKENGDRTDKFEQVVNSNLPKSFMLELSIFKGIQAEKIEVETFAQVDGREVSFVLLSPGAQSTEEEIRDKVIDEQIEKICVICPDIAIIEI